MNTKDPRAALTALIAALERHYDAAVASDGDDGAFLEGATDQLSETFERYDDALFDAYGVATPFVIFEDDDDYEDLDEDFEDFDELEDDLDDEDDEFEDDDDEDNDE
ncbi:MAG: DNA primase [Dermabacter sp.]|nr:DNA primase [Dermabacter sp.]